MPLRGGAAKCCRHLEEHVTANGPETWIQWYSRADLLIRFFVFAHAFVLGFFFVLFLSFEWVSRVWMD